MTANYVEERSSFMIIIMKLQAGKYLRGDLRGHKFTNLILLTYRHLLSFENF